jgi:hypothetical protein
MISYTCFQDIVDHATDYLGGNPSEQTRRDCVRAALEAYRDLCNAFNWTYLYTQGRLITTNAYDSTVSGATVAYIESSGQYPRQLTITGDVWPSWAANAVIRIGGVSGLTGGSSYSSVDTGATESNVVGYKVDQRVSATVLTLDPIISPSVDVPAGTPFMMYQDTYLLPEDFVAQDEALYEFNFGGMQYTHPREWLSPTSLVIQDPLDATYSGVGYMISDTVDIEPGAMLNAYLRCVEKHIGMARTLKDKPSAANQYAAALSEAKSADSRSFGGRSVQIGGRRYRPRLRDMPTGPDQP